MTIASLIVDVAANTVKLQQDVTKINSTLGSITTIAGKIGGVLAGAFTIRAVTSFVMDLIRTSAELVRVADQTGLTTTEVQKLSYIAGQSGNDLGQLTNALSMLQRKLVGGSDNTVQAVKVLGLNLTALRAASPYEMMEQIATALAKIPDPALRSALATELFGKAGAAALPTLISNFKELGDAAPLMKDKTVRALEQAGDAFETFTTTVKVWIAEAYNYAGRIFDLLVAKFYDFIAVQLRVTASILDLAKKIPGATKALDAMGVSTDDLRSAADSFNVTATYMRSKINEVEQPVRKGTVVVGEYGDSLEEAAKKAAKLRDEVAKVNASVMPLTTSIAGLSESQVANITPAEALRVNLNAIEDAAIATAASFSNSKAPGTVFKGLLVEIEGVSVGTAKNLANLGTVVEDLGPKFKESFEKGLKLGGSLADTIIGALQGGGSAIASAGAKVGQLFGQTYAKGVADELAKQGKSVSSALGVGLGIFTSAITFGIGSLVSILMSPTTGSRGTLATRLLGELKEAAGGMEALRVKAASLGLDLQRIFDASSLDDYIAGIEELRAALEFEDAAMQTLTDTVARYNFTIEEKGPALALLEQTKLAEQLYQDWRVLIAAGIQVDAVAREMSKSVSQYVQNAVTMNQEIPGYMRDQILKMIELGHLYDKNGQLITSLEGSGISFAETMSEGVDRIVEAVQALTNAITRGLGPAIRNVPDMTFRINIIEKLTKAGTSLAAKEALFPLMHDGGPVGRVLRHVPRAHDGLAIGEVPIIAQRGEVMFSRANVAAMGGVGATEAFRRGLGSGGRGSVVNFSTARLEAQIEALRKQQTKADEQQAARDRMMPALFGIAARDAVQQQARRR